MARSPGRRDDDRYVRDPRGYGRGSGSREVRRRSRSPGRRDLIRDQRRYDDRPRDGYRERSRDRHGDRRGGRGDRKRSRDRSPVRDRRGDRDRHYESRDYNDRDRKRSRRDDGPSRRPSRRDSIDRRSVRSDSVKGKESSRPSTADAAAEEEKKVKLAKVEAWKAKMAEKKRLEASPDGAAGLQVEIQDGDQASPAVDSPAPESPATITAESPTANDGRPVTPATYRGKFDPKLISQRAAARMQAHKDAQKAALGGDVVIPKSAKGASNANLAQQADNSKVATASGVNVIPNTANGGGDTKMSGFGLSKAAVERTANAVKSAADLGEDEATSRKLEKLPDLPTAPATESAMLANVPDDQDEAEDIRSDEEEAEAAREAAQRRAHEAQTGAEDVEMTNGEETAAVAKNAEPTPVEESISALPDDKMEVDEDVDPLDAFMNNLEKTEDPGTPNRGFGKAKNDAHFFNSDDETELDAIGDNKPEDILAIAAKQKKREVPTVDHTKVKYEDFRKNFYSESVDLAEMTKEDVDILRADLDNTKIRGVDPPKPILKFAQGGFGAQLLDVIRSMNYEKPTSIQSSALPVIMSGRDMIGVAKTGSGKTAAFILPMFRHIKDQRPLENLDGPISLILAPTRELATQIHRDCKPYVKALKLRAVCAYGGAPIKDQIAELKRGAEIVVCTPGRLIDLLAANGGRVINLKRVTYLVLDEADRMFDMGFEPQITKILGNIRPDRQTVLFSATFPPKMEALARKALKKPLEVIVGGRSVVAPEITQVIEVCSEGSKFNRVLELLGGLHDRDEDARSLIFVEKQETADNLFRDLLRKQYPCVSIHGGREQMDRDQAISDFKAGIYPVMVATSVAARGLDVKQLKLVINYDSPNHIEDYVHRVGRTGRAGNTGTAVTLVTPEQERFAAFLVKALTDSKQSIPEDLKALQESFQKKVKSGQARKAGSGFGGKGIERLDAARNAQQAIERKLHKTGDEPDEEEGTDEKKPVDAKASEVDKLVAKAMGQVKDRDAIKWEEQAASSIIIPTALNVHLDNAKKVQKAVTHAPTGRLTMSDKMAKAAAAAALVNSRLGARGATRPGVPIDNRGPDAGAFHATLEINDFPQKARWAVTNRTNVVKVLDVTSTSITSKGIYYPPGQEPGPGEQPKLYILVEGDTEVVVENAMKDLTDLLREGMMAHLSADSRSAPSGGRYSVL